MTTHRTPAALALLLPLTTAFAQTLVVPSGHHTTDAPSVLAAPGIELHRDWQIILDASLLSGVIGRDIQAILLRRDFTHQAALDPASAAMTVRLGSATRTADSASADPASNVQGQVEVFRGIVHAPASPASPASVSWDADQVIRITLTQPYRHVGGGLVLEIDTDGAVGVTWPVDAAESSARGAVRYLGTSCGDPAASGPLARIPVEHVVVGRSARFTGLDQAGSPGWLLLGAGVLAQPLDLGIVGAPGCSLWTTPLMALGATFAAPPSVPAEFGGIASVVVNWPSDPSLAGAAIGAQFLSLRPGSGIATTNGIECTLLATDPSFGMALVSSQSTGPAEVSCANVPVIAFEVQ